MVAIGCSFICFFEAGQYAKILVQLKGHEASGKALEDLARAKDALETAWEDSIFVTFSSREDSIFVTFSSREDSIFMTFLVREDSIFMTFFVREDSIFVTFCC